MRMELAYRQHCTGSPSGAIHRIVMHPPRLLCWFSCGAASAVATKLAIAKNAGKLPVDIVYTGVVNEHPDNLRFLRDCTQWFGHPVTVIQNARYGGDIYRVFATIRYLVGPDGAACTRVLKKEMRKAYERPNDVQVFGFTAEEQDRYDRFIDANNIHCEAPLIDHAVSKKDCLATIKAAGIELPVMYRMGYRNNNCIGCVKGGAGYWNKIRRDFPAIFWRMAGMELLLGRTINVDRIGGTRKRIYLRELKPDAGRYEEEPDISCGAVCVMPEPSMVYD